MRSAVPERTSDWHKKAPPRFLGGAIRGARSPFKRAYDAAIWPEGCRPATRLWNQNLFRELFVRLAQAESIAVIHRVRRAVEKGPRVNVKRKPQACLKVRRNV
jgi:hypothetical protein